MALKRKITKAEYDALSDAFKAEYTAAGDGYVLDVEDTGFDAIKEEKRQAIARAEAAEADLAARAVSDAAAAETLRLATEEAARAAGDVTALEASWKAKHEADVAAARAEGAQATTALTSVFVNKVAMDMAVAISTVPDLLVDRIKARLNVEIHAGVPITRVLSADGKPSALSLDDLKKEFVDNASYKSIIKASDANGGGAGEGGEGGGAPNKKLSEMTATEEAAFANKDPEGYQRALNA